MEQVDRNEPLLQQREQLPAGREQLESGLMAQARDVVGRFAAHQGRRHDPVTLEQPAPYLSSAGFQSRPVRNPKPKRCNVGRELVIIIPIIAATMIRINAAAMKRIVRKMVSPRRFVCANACFASLPKLRMQSFPARGYAL